VDNAGIIGCQDKLLLFISLVGQFQISVVVMPVFIGDAKLMYEYQPNN